MKAFLKQSVLTFTTALLAIALVLGGITFVAVKQITLDPIHHSNAVKIPKVLAQVMVTGVGANPSAMVYPGPVFFVWGSVSLAASGGTGTLTYPTGTCGHSTLAAWATGQLLGATQAVTAGGTVGTGNSGATILVQNGGSGANAAQSAWVLAFCT